MSSSSGLLNLRVVLEILDTNWLLYKNNAKTDTVLQIICMERYIFYEALKHGNAGNEQFITTNVISKGLIAVFIKGCFRILVKKYRYIDIIRT